MEISSALPNFELSSQTDRLLKEGHFLDVDDLLRCTAQSHMEEDPFLSQEPSPRVESPTLTLFPLCSLWQCLMQPSSPLTLPPVQDHFAHFVTELRLIFCSYLELLEVVAVARPVDLREEVLVEHLAHQLKQVDLHLVERLVLQQAV